MRRHILSVVGSEKKPKKMSFINSDSESPIKIEHIENNEINTVNSPVSVDASSASLGRSLPLIVYNITTRKFDLNPQSLKMIECNVNKVAMLTISGLSKTGKSFFMNKLIG